MKREVLYIKIIFLFTILLMESPLWAQLEGYVMLEGYTLNGRIADVSGNPVENVSISVENYNVQPVISDSLGGFEIFVPSGMVNILVNPVDRFHPKIISLNNRSEITVFLTPLDMESMDKSIKISHYEKRRRNLISSYKTYNPENYPYYPYETIDQYFQGVVPGMYVINTSGMPGSATSSFIRGIKSINTNNQPLYIVDGIPLETFGLFQSELHGFTYNPLTSLEPFDISNITILKDGYATALYGVRGSNGVVLIETLKPTELKTIIDLNYKTGIQFRQEQLFPQMDNDQHRTYANEILLTSDIPEENFPELYPALFSNEYTDDYHRYKHNTNWQDLIFRDGIMNEVQLRIKGGDEIARYGLSVGYMKKTGIIKSTDYSRLNIRLVGTFNIFKWLRMYISTHLNTNTSNLIESALSSQTSPILTSLHKTPMMMPYAFDRDGNQLSVLDDIGSLGVSNPYSIFENFKGINRNNHSLNSIRLEGDVTDRLKFTSLFGINLNTLSEDVFMPNYGMAYYYDGTAYNVSKKVKNFLYSIYFDNNISFKPELGSNQDLSLQLGVRSSMNKFENDIGISKNSYENDEYESLQNGVFYLKEIDGSTGRWNRLAAYINTSYAFRNKYLLNLAVSSEHSTRLGRNTDLMQIGSVPFANFYSIGAGWRISSEEFMKNIAWIEELKLRASYSISGNDDIGNTNALNFLMVDHYRETTGVQRGNFTDGSLKHETLEQLNAGMDISLYGNRLNLLINYYNITTKDMLVFEPQSFYTGFSFVPTNNGSVNTRGLEIETNLRIVNQSRFKWDLNVNITPLQKSEVLEIRDDRLVTSFAGGEFISETGQSILEFYGYEYDGVITTSEEAEALSLINEKGIPFVAGDARYIDYSGPAGVPDSIINDYDKVSLGSPLPEIYGGISNTFTYGRWSLNVGVYFVSGNKSFNYLRYQNEKMTDLSNQSTTALNRWYYEGHETDIPRALWEDPAGNSAFSSRWIEDASFLRIKNLTLSYAIPDQFLAFRNMKVYVTVNNLFTWSNYLGYDPEFSYSFNSMAQGIDYGLIPSTRSVIAGIKVGL